MNYTLKILDTVWLDYYNRFLLIQRNSCCNSQAFSFCENVLKLLIFVMNFGRL